MYYYTLFFTYININNILEYIIYFTRPKPYSIRQNARKFGRGRKPKNAFPQIGVLLETAKGGSTCVSV